MKGCVYIGQVTSILPIKEADRIEALEVVCGAGGKWQGVAAKGQFKVDDLCRVYLQDSLLPQTDEFSFMEKHRWRVKMCRFKKVPSEVLILPIPGNFYTIPEVGKNITEHEGVEKYEKPIPAHMAGEMLGAFPSFIPKTDEPNFQTVPEMIAALQGKPFYSTVKVDGSSATVYWYKDHFGCCSRNWEYRDTPGNAIWQIAKEYSLEERLKGTNLALQFEIAGPGIQGNPLGLKKVQPFLFNVYDIIPRKYLDARHCLDRWKIDMPLVPLIEAARRSFNFKDDNELRKYAEGTYPNGKPREGVVIRPLEEMYLGRDRVSFKVINLNYKD